MGHQYEHSSMQLLPELEEGLNATNISGSVARGQAPKTTSQIRGWKGSGDSFDTDDLKNAHIEKIFSEASPIQNYLVAALRSTRVSPNAKILTSKDFSTYYYRYYSRDASGIGGFTDKTKGLIFLRGNNFLQTRIEDAIHEGIHLLCHPPGATRGKVGSFSTAFGEYLDEGLTSYFSEILMKAQKFNNPVPKAYLANIESIKMLVMLITASGEAALPLFANAYFGDDRNSLFKCFQKIFGAEHSKFIEYSLAKLDKARLKKLIEKKLSENKNPKPSREYEINPNSQNRSSAIQPCQCNKEDFLQKENSNTSGGWDNDPQSFTKKAAEIHLDNSGIKNVKVNPSLDYCFDPEFFLRKCKFSTSVNSIQGTVLWSTATRQVTISICINGKRFLCWYNYFVDNKGVHLRNKKCLNKSVACGSI